MKRRFVKINRRFVKINRRFSTTKTAIYFEQI